MNGRKAHSRLMEDACKNFTLDIKQIDNLYELVKKETMGKATKKAYKELYNKTYLKEIEEKEKDFEEEATNIKINMGTLINSNYWRIEGIKNVYNTFQEEVSEKFDKDLSEYRIEEINDVVEEKKEPEKSKMKTLKLEDVVNNYNEDDYYKDNDKQDNSDESDFYDNDDYDDNDDDENDDSEYQDVVFDEEEEEAEQGYKDEKYEDDLEPYKYSYDDEEDEDYFDYDDEDEDDEDEEEKVIIDDDEITEEKIDQIIKNSRKGKKRKEGKQEIGLFGKLFKK